MGRDVRRVPSRAHSVPGVDPEGWDGWGWQIWETVTVPGGSPISPVLETREDLVDFLVTDGTGMGLGGATHRMSRAAANRFIERGHSVTLVGGASGLIEFEDKTEPVASEMPTDTLPVANEMPTGDLRDAELRGRIWVRMVKGLVPVERICVRFGEDDGADSTNSPPPSHHLTFRNGRLILSGLDPDPIERVDPLEEVAGTSMDKPNADDGRVTRERLNGVDAWHVANGWDWKTTWSVPLGSPGDALPPTSMEGLISLLSDLYCEVGLHAAHCRCDQLNATLVVTRRLLEHLADDPA
jgi:hypothetical protein